MIAQTASILAFLGPRIGLAPHDEILRAHALSLQLTVADLMDQTHDAHHPIAMSLYYEQQKEEALRRAPLFIAERIPKFLGYFERVLQGNGGQQLVGDATSYVDLSMFQLFAGLRYAFPNAMKRIEPTVPGLCALHDRIASRPRLAQYLASPRRIPFNQHGLFRHYPELDSPPS